MTNSGIERTLGEWRAKLAAMSRNISDLGDLIETPQCVGLKMRMKSKPETGGARPNLTNAQARAWAATRDELWECTKLVGSLIDQADQRVQSAWPWEREAKAEQALRMLETELIELRKADVPVLHRNLLGGTCEVERLTLVQMMDLMSATFERGKESLIALVAVEQDLEDRFARMESDIATLAGEGWTEADRARGLLAQARRLADEDPLRASRDIDATIGRDIAAAIAAAQSERKARETAMDDIGSARRLLEEITDAETRASDAAARTHDKVAGLTVARADRTQLIELAAWLDRLERTLQSGRLTAFSVGMKNWRAMCDTLKSSLADEESAFIAALERREELRARYETLRVKRNVRLNAGAIDAEGVEDSLNLLKSMLFGAATPIADAAKRLADLEMRVGRMSPPKQPERH